MLVQASRRTRAHHARREDLDEVLCSKVRLLCLAWQTDFGSDFPGSYETVWAWCKKYAGEPVSCKPYVYSIKENMSLAALEKKLKLEEFGAERADSDPRLMPRTGTRNQSLTSERKEDDDEEEDEEVVDSEAGAGRAAPTAGGIAHNIKLVFEDRLQNLKAYRRQHGQKCVIMLLGCSCLVVKQVCRPETAMYRYRGSLAVAGFAGFEP